MFQLDFLLLNRVDKNFLVFAAHDESLLVAFYRLDQVILTFVVEERSIL